MSACRPSRPAASGMEIRSATGNLVVLKSRDEGHAARSGQLLGKRFWFDDPQFHGHRTFLIRRQDNASRSLPMVQMDITLNVTPSSHLVDWWQVRTVTLERGRHPRFGLFELAAQEPCLE